MKRLSKLKYLIIHHSQRKNNNTLSSIKKAHLSRGFEDIGYHYIVTKTGKIISGRSEMFQGAHVFGNNKNSLGICLAGNFDKQKLNKNQLKSLIELLKQKITENKLISENILGHREFKNVKKTCPGENIDLDKIRRTVKKEMQNKNQKIHN